jgi:hypothetical protein
MAVRLLFNAKYNAHTDPLFKAAEVLPFNDLCDFFKIQFMQQFSQGFFYQSLSLTLGLQMLFGGSTSPE